jgi:uroporphyrinogen-III synthase
VSIGPVTSAALREAGLVVAAEAETASLDALVDAGVRLFAP